MNKIRFFIPIPDRHNTWSKIIGLQNMKINLEQAFELGQVAIYENTDLGRAELFELGRKKPYLKFVHFPVEIECEITIDKDDY